MEEFFRIVNKSFIILRYGGVRSLLRSIYAFLFFQADFYFYTKDLRNSAVEPIFSTPQDLIIKEISPLEMRKTREYISLQTNEFYRYEMDKPDFCYTAFLKGSLTHVSWVYSHSDGIIPLKPSEVEIKHCFTLPLYRGENIYPSVLNKISEDLKRRGMSRVYLKMLVNNKASIRGAEKAGFEKFTIVKVQRDLWTGRIKQLLTTT